MVPAQRSPFAARSARCLRLVSLGTNNAWLPLVCAAPVFLGTLGCGDGGPAVAGQGALRSIERDLSPAAVELRERIELGDVERAADLLATVAGRLGVEEPCLRARLAFLRGDEAGWLRCIEEARAAAPTDPRPYATAAELWAAANQLDAARAELQRGVAAVGELTPELERAKGVLALVTPGGTRVGLDCLQRAVARDPALPFVARPFGQAYLLTAKAALADQDPAGALLALEQSLAHDPTDFEARELHAQALYTNERFREAIAEYEALLAEGRDLRGELAMWHKHLGVLAQIAGDREAARTHYLRARELGLGDSELASGVHFLREEARRALFAGASEAAHNVEPGLAARVAEAATMTSEVDTLRVECASELFQRAVAALGRNEHAAALAAVEECVALADEDRLARVLRAKLYFAAGSYLEAADDYRWVVDDARAEQLELPEPVHLHLAASLALSGEREGARAVLREYLAEEPTGRWLEETRQRLRELESG
jgi:tetratricopeptide (TPR) repeat protein